MNNSAKNSFEKYLFFVHKNLVNKFRLA